MKMGPIFRDFFQKTDPKLRHIPYVLKCEYPPGEALPLNMGMGPELLAAHPPPIQI